MNNKSLTQTARRKPLASAVAKILGSSAAMGLAVMSHPLSAQERALEEVTVTAQKRAESLQDVPISVSAVTGAKLEEAGIDNIADIVSYVPNIHMTESGISTQLRVRGIGSGNNQGFEQSVGQYIDGIYYGRQQLIRAPFLDLERVEVLRGPQSTLFGKNSIAGALNMTTARPTEETEGSIKLGYTPQTDGTEVTGVISGALTDSFRARLAYRNLQEDGYIENTHLGKDQPSRDEQAVRATFAWDASDALTLTFKAERDTFDVTGRQIEIVQDDVLSATFQAFGQPAFESKLDGKRQTNALDYSNNTLENYTLTADYDLGGNTLTAVFGWVGYEYDELCDCDYTNADVFTVPMAEEYDQFSQEIRLTSPGGETVDWIVGAFYQTSEQDFEDSITLEPTTMIAPVLGFLGVPGAAALANTGAERRFEQTSDAWAVFGQATWNVSDTARLTLGGRYTAEDKTGARSLNAMDRSSGAPLADGAVAAQLYYGVFAIETEQFNPTGDGHNLEGERSESVFTPLVNFQYDLNNDVMLYASYTTGFKAGGYDARANNVNSFEFDEEKANAFELGAKTTFADGAAELNLALYRTDYKDLQISQFDGTLGFNVGNVKDTRVQGLELDGRWRLTDSLVANYAASYLDFEYQDFENGNCYTGQMPDGDIAPWGTPLCSYTGKAGQYSPELTFNAGLQHNMAIAGDLELRSALDLQYVDSHNVHANLDPQYEADAYTTINARIALEAENWNLALLGKNLTDESIMTYAGNVPLSGTFGANTYYAFIKPARTLALEASYQF